MTDVVTSAVAQVIEPIEAGFDAFGLMRGSNAPLKRFVVTSALTSLVIWSVRPQWAFMGGEPRPWTMFTGPNVREGAQPTATPWWIIPLGVGLVSSFLI